MSSASSGDPDIEAREGVVMERLEMVVETMRAIAGEVRDEATDQGTLRRLVESLAKIAPSVVTTAIVQLISLEIPDLF